MFLCIVTLYGARLDDDARVALLVVLTLVRDRTYHVAARQSERGAQRRQRSDQHANNDLDNLLPGHSA